MRGKIILLVLFVIVCGFSLDSSFSQNQLTELEQVKIVLADMTMHANVVEKENIRISTVLQNLANDLRNIKEPSVELLDILDKYGIQPVTQESDNGTDNNR